MDRPRRYSKRDLFTIVGSTASGLLLAACNQYPKRTDEQAINDQLAEIARSGMEGPHPLEDIVAHRQNPNIRPELLANIHTVEIWWTNKGRLVSSRIHEVADRVVFRQVESDQSMVGFQFDPARLILKTAPRNADAETAARYPGASKMVPESLERGLARTVLELSPAHYRKVFS